MTRHTGSKYQSQIGHESAACIYPLQGASVPLFTKCSVAQAQKKVAPVDPNPAAGVVVVLVASEAVPAMMRMALVQCDREQSGSTGVGPEEVDPDITVLEPGA
ncbi:hypothetical protein NDU88_004191 [Pleurodeles waltl]|uniref:Uncharacterized protein n=1 Tax=Pleurodeles waltl TaxID=8319 RepID=A0AAV7MSY8_PLEWA|nr:hypothetical protein NDU88_004191 [Pleurodeles waltl]